MEKVLEHAKEKVEDFRRKYEAFREYQLKTIKPIFSAEEETALMQLNDIAEECLCLLKRLCSIKQSASEVHVQGQTLFEEMLKRVLLVFHQEERILNSSQDRKTTFNISVCLLGWKTVSPKSNPENFPAVSLSLNSEQHLESSFKLGKPPSDSEYKLNCSPQKLHQTKSGLLVANFEKVNIGKMTRKAEKDQKVSHFKYGLVFKTKIEHVLLQAISLPIFITTAPSQYGQCAGALIWDSIAAVQGRKLFQEQSAISTDVLIDKINDYIDFRTSRPLDEQQKKFLEGKIPTGSNGDGSKAQVTKDQFLKNHLENLKFDYWSWVYGCVNLICHHLSDYWQAGYIHGFISREQVTEILWNKKPGTFLFCFRERGMNVDMKKEYCADLKLAVNVQKDSQSAPEIFYWQTSLTAKNLRDRGLEAIITDYVQSSEKSVSLQTNNTDTLRLNFLAPNIPVNNVFNREELKARKDRPDPGYAKIVMVPILDVLRQTESDAERGARLLRQIQSAMKEYLTLSLPGLQDTGSTLYQNAKQTEKNIDDLLKSNMFWIPGYEDMPDVMDLCEGEISFGPWMDQMQDTEMTGNPFLGNMESMESMDTSSIAASPSSYYSADDEL